MALTREQIKAGAIRRMIAEGDPGIPLLTDEEFEASRRALLAEIAAGADAWVFGYGSLIWNPAFHFVERRVGRVYGYHRRFCLWTHLGRGSKANPGLTLGLDRGGSCRGIAFRVAADAVESEFEVVWRREMITGAYRPRWLDVHTNGGVVRGLGFTINHDHERYAGLLPEDTAAAAIATAEGELGPCAEYLFNTVAHLEAYGIHDRALGKLNVEVAAIQREREDG